MTLLHIVCAYCHTEYKPATPSAVESVSHGICPSCLAQQMARLDAEDAARAGKEAA